MKIPLSALMRFNATHHELDFYCALTALDAFHIR